VIVTVCLSRVSVDALTLAEQLALLITERQRVG